ncbi:hypothetical protein SLA2020_478210 [Shorea laevis]
MDSSWHVKCGSSFQSPAPSMASSAPQEHRNQMEMNSGQYFYPNGTQDIRSTLHERTHDSMSPNGSHLSFQKTNHSDLGNSYLTLPSRPPSQLHYDFQELSNARALSISRSANVNALESRVSQTSSGLLSGNWINHNVQDGVHLSPAAPSRSVFNSISGSGLILPDSLQTTHLNLQTSDLAKAVIHHLVPGDKKVKDLSSNKGEWCGTTSANARNLHGKTVLKSSKIPPEAKSSLSNQSTAVLSGCPRVFCLGTSGYLLLSNTGLIGIVCSCHVLHMSVSKFCEHSGLCDMSPGDAVRVESGETIAHWRKRYFEKFGIRVPEDPSGWDWPEGLSVTAGLMKSSAAMHKISDNSDLDNLVASPQGLAMCGENISCLKNPHMDQNLSIDPLHNKQQRNVEDSSNFLPRGSIGTSQSNLRAVADNHIVESAASKSSSASKFVGRVPDNGSHSISAWIDTILKTGNPCLTHASLQNLKARGQSCVVNTAKIAQDGVIGDNKSASSNIELRLGQPYQQSQSLRNYALPLSEPKPLGILADPPKSCYPEQKIHCANNCSEREESRQYFHRASGPSNSAAREEQRQSNFGDPTFDVSNTRDATKLRKFEVNIAKGSVVPPFTHLPPEKGVCSKSTSCIVEISESVMPKTLYCESNAPKAGPINVLWSGGSTSQRLLNVPELGFLRLIDKSKGTGFVSDGSCVATEPAVKIQKQIDSPSVFTGAVGGSSSHSFPAVHVKNHFPYQSSNVVTDIHGARNLFNHPVNSPFFGSRGHTGHAFIRSTASSVGSSQISQSSAASTGFPFSTLTPTPDLASTISKQGGFNLGPNLLDESMKLLAMKQIFEPSKQHAIPSIGINHEPGRYCCSSTPNLQHSILDLSTSGEQRHGPGPISPSKLDVSKSSLMSYPSEKAAQVTGLNNWCNLSTMTQGFPLCSREIDVPCHFSNEPFSSMQPTLSLGRSESLSQSGDHLKCCQRAPSTYFLHNCSCAAQAKCLEYSESRVGHSPVASKEELRGFCHEATVLVSASEFVRDHIVSKERTMSMDKRGELIQKLPRSQCCHTSQWRDVPSKKKEDCDKTCMGWSEKGAQNMTFNNSSATELDNSGNAEGQLGDTAAKRFIGSLNVSDSLKGHEMSNISSGCSAPAVTQASFEVNNVDSSTVYAGETENANNLIVDEGSTIDKCCSSDDVQESERSADSLGAPCKSNMKKRKVLNGQSSRSLLDELKLINSLTWKKGRNQIPIGLTTCGKSDHLKEVGIGLKAGKRKKFMKLKMIDAVLPSDHERRASVSCSLRTGLFSSNKELPHKRALHRLYNDSEEDTCQPKVDGYAESSNILEVSVRKKLKRAWASESVKEHETDEPIHKVAEKTSNFDSVCCEKALLSDDMACGHRKAKPVVCGKYGEICGELGGDELKPAKIIPLSRILKIAKRIDQKSYKAKLMKRRTPGNTECFDLSSDLKKEEKCGSNHSSGFHGVSQLVVDEAMKACVGVSKQSDVKSSMWEKERVDKSEKNKTAYAQSSHNYKEIRRRSLYELTVEGKESHSPLIKIPQCMPRAKVRNSLKKAEDGKHGSCEINTEKNIGEPGFCSDANSDVSCCVCGSSKKDEINDLLECSQCSILVHQACYGVLKVPKGNWYCRPCRAGAKNMACVLCGYGGGAMTQALRSRTIVKTLLKAWNIEAECRTKNTPSVKTMLDRESLPHSSSAVLDHSYCISRHGNIESSGSAVWKMDLQNKLDAIHNSSCCASKLKVHNSITAGVLDSNVKQWVHMICGLWTPGTRCPNVDTMSAFDVSDVSRPRENEVCSICNRPGGTCIQCRVKSCSVKFHPWCAHQKGLLQSEVEGVDNENVGFYGRCISHATCHTCESGGDQSDAETICPVERELTCARTGGFKGRKQDGFLHSIHDQLKRKSRCFVPQEQLNAWVHINGQKSCIQGLPNRTTSDIEYDCRKEYARYKQSKGWKHLVVYKSGIHALGLYTSRFISRGEMVVEYVGEIVGIRVADKRESEYMSGRKVQYKSACYFFRIDKEHIIDATRKGGIARFVNHSCLPNCVAKVISVRNEKKVVFFAERDIYPGEEITYDYHFNHEDEGKKIPCFCNSKNCRRYLN